MSCRSLQRKRHEASMPHGRRREAEGRRQAPRQGVSRTIFLFHQKVGPYKFKFIRNNFIAVFLSVAYEPSLSSKIPCRRIEV